MTAPSSWDSLTDRTVNPENPDAIEDGYAKGKPRPTDFTYGDEYQPGFLLAEPDPKKVAKKLFTEWTDQDRLHNKHLAQCRANKLRREGHINVQVVKSQDYDRYEEWSWGGPVVPHLNYAATLCRKAVANLYADPPIAEALPASGDPDDLDSAEFASRVLEDITSESGLDDVSRGREAFDLASTYASAFRYFRINPRGERVPLEIEAHPLATSAEKPFSMQQPVTDPMTGQPPMDPTTGQPQLDPATGQPPMQDVSLPGPYILRYVRPDGSLTDKKAEAAYQWVPKIEEEVVTSRNVRFLPATAPNIWQAHGVLIGGFKSIGELRKMFEEEFQALSPEQIEAMTKYRPERPDDFLPGRGRAERNALDEMKGDHRLVFVLTCYYTECSEYPKGAQVVCAGDEVMLHRQEWSVEMEDGEECLMIPLTQYTQFKEGREGQYGVALMELLGPGNELRAAQLGAALEHLDRFNSRKIFLPTTSTLDPTDLENPSRSVLPMNPGGQPFHEEIPDFPEMAMQVYSLAQTDMDHTSGLEQAAQGVEDPSVQSGRHARVIVAQVHAGLSELRQNVERATVRAYRIMLQLVRGYYTKPQKLRWTGQDGRFMERRWSRADLKSTKDVRLKPATLTMLSPGTKIDYVNELVQMGLIPPDEARDLLSSSLAATAGWKDEPHRLRIKRQIGQWNDGPPEGWQPPPPPQPQVGMGPQGPVQMPPAPPPPDPLWQPIPADELPPVAQIRLLELAKAMASVTFQRWPPEWQQGLVQEFQHMQQVVQQAMAPPPAPAAPGGPPSDQGGSEPPPTPAERQMGAAA